MLVGMNCPSSATSTRVIYTVLSGFDIVQEMSRAEENKYQSSSSSSNSLNTAVCYCYGAIISANLHRIA